MQHTTISVLSLFRLHTNVRRKDFRGKHSVPKKFSFAYRICVNLMTLRGRNTCVGKGLFMFRSNMLPCMHAFFLMTQKSIMISVITFVFYFPWTWSADPLPPRLKKYSILPGFLHPLSNMSIYLSMDICSSSQHKLASEHEDPAVLKTSHRGIESGLLYLVQSGRSLILTRGQNVRELIGFEFQSFSISPNFMVCW